MATAVVAGPEGVHDLAARGHDTTMSPTPADTTTTTASTAVPPPAPAPLPATVQPEGAPLEASRSRASSASAKRGNALDGSEEATATKSIAESTNSSLISSAAKSVTVKLKEKIKKTRRRRKNLLHRRRHADGPGVDHEEDDGDDDDDEEEDGEDEDDDDDEADQDDALTQLTEAQAYAAKLSKEQQQQQQSDSATAPPAGVASTDYATVGGSSLEQPPSNTTAAPSGPPALPPRGSVTLPRSSSRASEMDRASIKSSTSKKSTKSHRTSLAATLPAPQSDWKRKAEFHNLFPGEITEEEELISDYTSAWSKDILRHGRLYVGAKHLAFNCSILGLKAQCVLPYEDIVSIEKAVTARVLPNAISITTKQNETYVFTSFVYRDTSFDLIIDCWRASNPLAFEKMANAELEEELVEEVMDEDGGTTTTSPEEPVAVPAVATSTVPAQQLRNDTARSPPPNELAASSPPVAAATQPKKATSSPAAIRHPPHPKTSCTGNHFKENVLDVNFPSEPAKIFNLLYKDDAFQQHLCLTQNLTDLKILPWVPTGRGDLEKRSFSYTKPLNGTVGPSSTTCYITDEELLKDPERCYEVLSITKTPDVPSGGSFEVQTKTCLTWAGGPKSGCQMVVTTECVWSGRSMIKGIVTSASIAGQRDYNKHLAKLVRAHIAAHPVEYLLDTSSTAPVTDGTAADERVEKDGDAPPVDIEREADEYVEGSGSSPGRREPRHPHTPHPSHSRYHSDSLLGALTNPIKKSDITVALLALSNTVFLVLFLVSLVSGGSVNPFSSRSSSTSTTTKALRTVKSVMSPQQELEALARLDMLEEAWRGFKTCVDALVADKIDR